jgi:hypothetical protein
MVHREAFPAGPPVFEEVLWRSPAALIFDFDDAVYLPNVSATNRRFGWMKMTGKTKCIVKRADLVTAGNPHLASWARQHNANVQVMPTTIDTGLYAPLKRSKDDGPLCIGWSGSRTTIEHLRTLGPVLRDVQAERGVKLEVSHSRCSQLERSR